MGILLFLTHGVGAYTGNQFVAYQKQKQNS